MTARLLILAAACAVPLASCNTAPYVPQPPSPRDQQRLADFIGNRTPGPITRCIPAYSGMQIDAIGDQIVAKWGGRVWINQVQGSCRMADTPNALLVTEPDPAGQYCENSTFKVVSSSGGMIMGTCGLGPWVPYTR